jgi:HSP20 family protein
VEASLPGIPSDQLEITALGNTLTIQVTTKREQKVEKEGTYVRQERYVGEMSRTIGLPGPIDREKITATYDRGILTLHIPKAEEAKSKRITVQVKEGEGGHYSNPQKGETDVR